MRRLVAVAVWVVALGLARADVQLPALRGFVTDAAGVLSADEEAHMTATIEELQRSTGAEIAVVTVDSTAPLDDFSYAMKIAEAWRPGRRGEDTGVVVLAAVRDRKLRILTGYGIEGILPDGAVGEIEDQEVIPEFRAGRVGRGLVRGVDAIAARIAAGRGAAGRPPPSPARSDFWPWLVLVVILVIVLIVLYETGSGPAGVAGRRRRGGVVWFPWYGGSGGFGGFGGGGGGFGGFGGGSFGGGGAGRSW